MSDGDTVIDEPVPIEEPEHVPAYQVQVANWERVPFAVNTVESPKQIELDDAVALVAGVGVVQMYLAQILKSVPNWLPFQS